jgi:uncharacterized protein DUF5906
MKPVNNEVNGESGGSEESLALDVGAFDPGQDDWKERAMKSIQEPLPTGLDRLKYAKAVELALNTRREDAVFLVKKVIEFQENQWRAPISPPADCPNEAQVQTDTVPTSGAGSANGTHKEARTQSEEAEEQEKDGEEPQDEHDREWEGRVNWFEWSLEETDTDLDSLMQPELPDFSPDGKKKRRKKVWQEMVARTYWKNGKYWFLNDNLRWEAYQKEDLLTILEGTFFFDNIIVDHNAAKSWKVAKFEAFKRRILTRNNVSFVGELAGRKKGITTWRGDSYLLTKGPVIVKPIKGEFPTIRGVLDDLLGQEQLQYFHAWLKTSYEALRDGEMSTGQVLVLAGPAGIGKSFITEFIIRPILGGRHTDPTSYLQGRTHFNADTARAESWEIDDSVGISDSHKRKMYSAAFKKLAATNDHRIEAKGKDAIQPPPVFHRLSVYSNDDAYDL